MNFENSSNNISRNLFYQIPLVKSKLIKILDVQVFYLFYSDYKNDNKQQKQRLKDISNNNPF